MKRKNSTVKKYANRPRQDFLISQGYDVELGIRPEEKKLSTFDHMSAIFLAKSKKEGEIFLIDDDIDALLSLINLIKQVDSEGVKIGVLFRISGHTTPFCIEKLIDDDDKEQVVAYHTDAVVMDIDQSDEMHHLVKEVAKIIPIYSLGFQDTDRLTLRDFKRQSDHGSCATYALFDVEEIIEDPSFNQFVKDNSNVTDDSNIFDLQALPPVFMSTIQSIEGCSDAGVTIRNGLRYLVEQNKVPAQQQIKINGELTTLLSLMDDVTAEGIPNPIIDIMNEANFTYYEQAQDYAESIIHIYHLDNKKLKENIEHFEDKISQIAVAQFEAGADDDEVQSIQKSNISDAKDKDCQSSQAKTSAVENQKERNKLIIFGIIMGVIILEVLQRQTIAMRSQYDRASNYDSDEISDDEVESSVSSDEISDDDMINSAFAKGTNTAKLLGR
ncbi:MAG: hypothetical protein HOM96_05710 [Rickettsiales bacterium]|jgi:hypothetical protein|nr:hypothetical protein [Rickettsiales bacterium]